MTTAKHRIRMAGPGDDAALRRLLRETPLPGGLSVTLEREPSFFDADVDVLRHDTVWLDGVGCGSRLLKRALWHGEAADVAYCADLRVHPSQRHRSGVLLRRAFEVCDDVQQSHPAAVTWTAAFEENVVARRVLESGRVGLPRYLNRGRLHCPALLTFAGKTLPSAEESDWEEIAEFLNTKRRLRPLAPVCDAASFDEGKRWPGLHAHDVLLKRQSGRLTGVVAVHDVRHCRQVVVQRLPAWLRLLRCLGASRFVPAEGEPLSLAYASLLTADDVATARELLLAARAEAARRGIAFLMVAFHEADPLAAATNRLLKMPFTGRLYEIHRGKPVDWPAGVPLVEAVAL